MRPSTRPAPPQEGGPGTHSLERPDRKCNALWISSHFRGALSHCYTRESRKTWGLHAQLMALSTRGPLARHPPAPQPSGSPVQGAQSRPPSPAACSPLQPSSHIPRPHCPHHPHHDPAGRWSGDVSLERVLGDLRVPEWGARHRGLADRRLDGLTRPHCTVRPPSACCRLSEGS